MSPDIDSFEIGNYKSIKNSGQIKTPGISIILGPNSSGKTNILESLLLLKQTFENNQTELKLNGNIIKTGEFVNIAHNKKTSNNLSYKFNFSNDLEEQDPRLICPICQKEYTYEGYYTNHMEDKHPEFWEKFSDEDRDNFADFYSKKSYIKLEYEYNESDRSTALHSLEIGNPDPVDGLHISELKVLLDANKQRLVVRDKEGEIILKSEIGAEEDIDIANANPNYLGRQISNAIYLLSPNPSSKRRFRFIPTPQNVGENAPYVELEQLANEIQSLADTENFDEIEDEREELYQGFISRLVEISYVISRGMNRIQSFVDEMDHIGPLRNSPRRIYFGAGGSPGLQAEQGTQVEKQIFSANRSQDQELIDSTNEWLSETGFDCQLDVSPVGVGDLYQLNVEQSGLSVNLADAGFGLSQTLPIIVKCVNMRLDKEQSSPEGMPHFYPSRNTNQQTLGLIEQPEIHLNPKIESSLGDFFINVMESGVNLMIETHSEHLLNRIQRRVADNSIEDEEAIRIYFVTKEEEEESEIREIEISASGTFSEWPEGFFQDDFEDAMEILKESI